MQLHSHTFEESNGVGKAEEGIFDLVVQGIDQVTRRSRKIGFDQYGIVKGNRSEAALAKACSLQVCAHKICLHDVALDKLCLF